MTNVERLRMITFFGDVLFVYQRFHKKMQWEFLTLPKFCQYVKNVIDDLNSLRSNPLPGGFLHTLNNQMKEVEIESEDPTQENQKKVYLKEIELFAPESSRREPMTLQVLRTNVIDLLTESLSIRLESQNEDLLKTIEAFLKFDENFDVSLIHELIGKDLNLAPLHLQYTDLSKSSNEIKGLTLLKLLKYLAEPSRIKFFTELITVVARIAACTPNSADCERVVSANI